MVSRFKFAWLTGTWRGPRWNNETPNNWKGKRKKRGAERRVASYASYHLTTTSRREGIPYISMMRRSRGRSRSVRLPPLPNVLTLSYATLSCAYWQYKYANGGYGRRSHYSRLEFLDGRPDPLPLPLDQIRFPQPDRMVPKRECMTPKQRTVFNVLALHDKDRELFFFPCVDNFFLVSGLFSH